MEQQKQKCVATSAESKSTGKRKVTVGSVWSSNSGDIEVLSYTGSKSVYVRFINTGFETITSADQVRRGLVKDKLNKGTYGIGFNGVGEFNQCLNGKPTKASKAWTSMLQRCYCKKLHRRCPTYSDCSVCEEWHNFQNFAKWFYENYPDDGRRYDLDKDVKVIGNKIYSPQSCMFVSQVVNNFTLVRNVRSGKYMVGVSFHKRSGKLRASCKNSLTGKSEHVGSFDCEMEAHLAWRKRKSEIAHELAMIQDNDEVKQALLRWKCALDNFEIHKI